MAEISSSRIVITVLGKNRPGIVAGVTRVLGEANVDIRDITQSIIEDIFTMTMLADTAESKLDFAELQKALAEAGELSGVNVSIQREDVFNFMYRLYRTSRRGLPDTRMPMQATPMRPGEERAWPTTPRKSITASMTT